MRARNRTSPRVVALSGGVGGARLVHGLARVLPAESLTVVVNTGDDFEHWGLKISPDVDTVMYTLADLAPVERGWGLAEESFATLGMMERLGADAWFRLGDRDLATHIVRTQSLAQGQTLTEVTARLASALGVWTRILPMCDGPRPTLLDTDEHGTIPFQTWFVRHGARPRVRRVHWAGAPTPSSAVLDALARADLVVFGPSNPYVSIDPILALRGVREAVFSTATIAVSPIVHGAAVKGPLARMVPDLAGVPPTPGAIANHYLGGQDGGTDEGLGALVVERGDEHAVGAFSPDRILPTSTVMGTREDGIRLAREILAFAERLP